MPYVLFAKQFLNTPNFLWVGTPGHEIAYDFDIRILRKI